MITLYNGGGSMTGQELYDGVARAVEAAKPAQEYCFVGIQHWSTCMTKAEWSGWMQAIGSFVALLIAIGIPAFNARSTKARNFGQARHAIAALGGTINAIESVAAVQGTLSHALRAARNNFSDLGKMWDEVRSSDLPPDARPAWVALRVLLAGLIAMTKEMQSPPDERFAEADRVYLQETKADILRLGASFARHDPSILNAAKRRIGRLLRAEPAP